jgi:hypothetical protein
MDVGSINDTGFAIRAVLASGKVALLTGDVDYSLLPKALSGPCDYLLVSHHGARMKHGSAAIPKPTTGGAAAVSYGRATPTVILTTSRGRTTLPRAGGHGMRQPAFSTSNREGIGTLSRLARVRPNSGISVESPQDSKGFRSPTLD